jgi:N-acetylglucosamine transport system substrate-binding protein
VPWNCFVAGKLSFAYLTMALQVITDKVANDSSVKKIEIK